MWPYLNSNNAFFVFLNNVQASLRNYTIYTLKTTSIILSIWCLQATISFFAKEFVILSLFFSNQLCGRLEYSYNHIIKIMLSNWRATRDLTPKFYCPVTARWHCTFQYYHVHIFILSNIIIMFKFIRRNYVIKRHCGGKLLAVICKGLAPHA